MKVINDFYDMNYDKNLLNFGVKHRINKICNFLEKYKIKNCKILDLGCGNGNISIIYKTKTASDLYGVDISEKAVMEAKKKKIKAIKKDLNNEKIPFKNEFFDVVIAGEIIEHVFDTDFLLEEIHRVLKNDGILILSTPNIASWHGRISLLLGFIPYGIEPGCRKYYGTFLNIKKVSGHIRGFTLISLKKMIKQKNFKILEISSSPLSTPYQDQSIFRKILLNFDLFISKIEPCLSTTIIIVCKKANKNEN